MKKILGCLAIAILGACDGQTGSGQMPLPNPFAKWQYHCEAPLNAGVACTDSFECAPGLHCHPTNRVCAPPGGKGAECQSDRGCQSPFACKAKYADMRCFTMKCDASGNNCQQDRPTGKTCNPGETCGANELCTGGESLMSTCEDRAKAGASCDAYTNGGCASGYVCQIGTARCVPMPKEGEPCPMPFDRFCSNTSLVCLSDVNGGSTCEKAIPVGGHCSSGGECAKGAHCNLSTLICDRNVGPGDRCKNGNECGEAPFDRQIGVECVKGTCVDTSVQGADCWPNDPSQCTNGRVCRKS